MTGFSADWLTLREPADHRSRSLKLTGVLNSWFLQRETLSVVDLGCGTGSNLRATAELLPTTQMWTLVDLDPALLAAARSALAAWADSATSTGDALQLTKGSRTLTVQFRQANLQDDLDTCLEPLSGGHADLVTASALFDLASPEFIKRFAAAVAKRQAVFYTVLTYNGVQHWTPRSPIDQQLTGAFCRHQMADKGLGISAGPTAPVHLADQFQTHGYRVEEGDSPWRLGPSDAALIAELATGFAEAVRQTKSLPPAELDAWIARKRTGAEVGHTDTLAIPGSGSALMGERD
jgi:SAM-dependent methyltransferase